jgi:hypothetical protein
MSYLAFYSLIISFSNLTCAVKSLKYNALNSAVWEYESFYLTNFMESMSTASKRSNMNARIQEEFAFTQCNWQESDLPKTFRRRSKIHSASWIGVNHEMGMWKDSDGITGSIPYL